MALEKTLALIQAALNLIRGELDSTGRVSDPSVFAKVKESINNARLQYIFECQGAGISNVQIAETLGITPSRVTQLSREFMGGPMVRNK